MNNKKWYLSKGVWGGVIGVITGTILLVDQYFGTTLSQTPWFAWIVSIAGSFGLIGRINATTKISA